MFKANIPTPHIELADPSLIAETVLMPGDPLRAKMIAETFLEDVIQFNGVRGMLGYTGTYKGKKISVMGSGMGMPSIGIYSYELYAFYGVEHIIRVGSCGSYSEDLNVYDVMLCTEAYSESTFAKVQSSYDSSVIEAGAELLERLRESAKRLNIPIYEGRVHSSDVFYRQDSDFRKISEESGAKAVEMESFSLFANAKVLNKQAACLLTVSDSFVSGEVTSSEERQNAFTKMIEIALNV